MQAAKPISRREMLYYLAGGTALLATAAVSAGTLWFLQQPPRIGEDWLPVPLEQLKMIEYEPLPLNRTGSTLYAEAFLTVFQGGAIALIPICPYELERYYPFSYRLRWWQPELRFQCPGCGSQFSRDGTYVSGRSSTSLARYVIHAQMPDGWPWSWIITPPNGAPIDLTHAEAVYVDLKQAVAILRNPL